MKAERITLLLPDDWHVHLRDGESMKSVVPYSARRFGRAVIMPNLPTPVTNVARALAYRDRIRAAIPLAYEQRFRPMMTLFLTDQLSDAEIGMAAGIPDIIGAKLYPAGATTHSEAGVGDLRRIYPQLESMQRAGLPLLVHAEPGDPAIDIFDREAFFIEHELAPMVARFPALRVTVEHITTREAVAFVREAGDQVGATITAHHLLLNRNDLLAGGIRPHHYCLPVVKRESHRRAVLEAAVSGEAGFFLGTDSAPHPKSEKQSACGCAGIFSAHAALELYAEVFDDAGALDRLEGFASLNGPRFYGLEPNRDTISLVRREWRPPEELPFAERERLVPLRGGQVVRWSLAGEPDDR